MPQVKALDHLVLTVADIARSVRFYEGALGITAEAFPVADGSQRWALKFGDQKINLHSIEAPFVPHADVPTAGSADLCFLTDTPLADWTLHLAGLGVAVIDGPVRRTGATGPIMSIYMRDPDGNLIEVAVRD